MKENKIKKNDAHESPAKRNSIQVINYERNEKKQFNEHLLLIK
jgi:hypothetical protein